MRIKTHKKDKQSDGSSLTIDRASIGYHWHTVHTLGPTGQHLHSSGSLLRHIHRYFVLSEIVYWSIVFPVLKSRETILDSFPAKKDTGTQSLENGRMK